MAALSVAATDASLVGQGGTRGSALGQRGAPFSSGDMNEHHQASLTGCPAHSSWGVRVPHIPTWPGGRGTSCPAIFARNTNLTLPAQGPGMIRLHTLTD